MRLILSFTIGFLLLFLPLASFAKEKNNSDQQKKQEQQIKEFVIKQAKKEDRTRLRIKLKTGSYYVGYLQTATDENFVITTDKAGSIAFVYSEIAKIKSGYSRTEKFKIGILSPIYVGQALYILFILQKS